MLENIGRLYESEARLDRDELAGLLESIAARVREGSLTLGEGPDALALNLPEVFTVEMQVEDSKRKPKRELELEIEWAIDAEGNPTETPGPASGFTVS